MAERLREKGRAVTVTREPGGTAGAECVRHVLLSGRAQPYGAELEAVLFAAARRDNVEQNIRPALRAGHVVLCDRYMDSSRAYQGAADGAEMEFMRGLEEAVVEGARPDLTLIFDMPVERSFARMRERDGDAADRFERDGPERHERRRAAFLRIAANEPERCRVIDADQPADAVTAAVSAAVERAMAGGDDG